ncbi:MAG: hypothetical protein OEV44_12915 [Spirochaetota bacterium]|nr:hypothetical protein [Spirochaetota bacterium]
MSQHFLLSSKSRSLSILDVSQMSDQEVFNTFRQIRWKSTNGRPVILCSKNIKMNYQ